MSKRLAPESDLRPDAWQELLAVTVEAQIRDEGFDAPMTAIEAGLTEAETEMFRAWVRKIEEKLEARQMRNEIGITTERMLEWMKNHPDEPFPEF